MTSQPRKAILIVDHELGDLELMCNVIRRGAYKAIPASGYLAGLNAFRMHAGEVDLLVTAVALPERNGCELAQKLLEMKPSLNVLFASAYSGAEMCRYYGLVGEGLYFLEKPLKEDEFMRMIRLILDSASAESAAAGQE